MPFLDDSGIESEDKSSLLAEEPETETETVSKYIIHIYLSYIAFKALRIKSIFLPVFFFYKEFAFEK